MMGGDPSQATLEVSQHSELGAILTDASGLTLYLFTKDEMDTSNCTGTCVESWPPLLTMGDPQAGEGVAAASIGTITRDDGSVQVTYNHWPLYHYANDVNPGDATGQNRGSIWFVVDPDASLTVRLKELNESGQKGLAVLTGMGEQTNVVLYATADISEANHIHLGDCMTPGGVEHGLTNMADGMSVTVVDAAVDTLTAGGLAIRLHMVGDLSVYTSCGEISETPMMSDDDMTGGETTSSDDPY